ncbi:hypothetical protein EVAR_104018_1 [Eumeta japonica]|uniref:Uncharacterized protein n=1 Tax=Eumeta variegata TaxID=151549 RepID=A0A4C1XWT4_EUMVA|nr:hypothetical protein EVAR_104018_1 [Eumeta japonica]
MHARRTGNEGVSNSTSTDGSNDCVGDKGRGQRSATSLRRNGSNGRWEQALRPGEGRRPLSSRRLSIWNLIYNLCVAKSTTSPNRQRPPGADAGPAVKWTVTVDPR